MAARDLRAFEALSERRAARARELADRHPAAREVLAFYAAAADFQREIAARATDLASLVALRPRLVDLVRAHAPEALQSEAEALDDVSLAGALERYRELRDTTAPRGCLARVLLTPLAAAGHAVAPHAPEGEGACPRCGHPPQVGVLRPLQHGSDLALVCSLCLHEWRFPRGRCARCGAGPAELAYYTTDELRHVRIHACNRCRAYHHAIDLEVEPTAIADVDELTALPLDVWAGNHGYRKLQPNLAGI